MAIRDVASIQKVVDDSNGDKVTAFMLYGRLERNDGEVLREGLPKLEIADSIAQRFNMKWDRPIEKYRLTDNSLKAMLVEWILKYPDITSRHVEEVVRRLAPINNKPFRALFIKAAATARKKHAARAVDAPEKEWVQYREAAALVGRSVATVGSWARMDKILSRRHGDFTQVSLASVKAFVAEQDERFVERTSRAEDRRLRAAGVNADDIAEIKALVEATARAVLYIKDQVDVLVANNIVVPNPYALSATLQAPTVPGVQERELQLLEPRVPHPATISADKKEAAAKLVFEQGMTLRAAAESVGMSSRTLRRYIEERTAPVAPEPVQPIQPVQQFAPAPQQQFAPAPQWLAPRPSAPQQEQDDASDRS